MAAERTEVSVSRMRMAKDDDFSITGSEVAAKIP